MLSIRLWFALTVLWLLVFFNIERFHEPINIASFVYVLAGVSLAGVLACPPTRKMPLAWQLLIVSAFLLLLKFFLGYSITGPSLPLTITELCALGLTLWLANGVSTAMFHFDRSLAVLASTQDFHHLLAALPTKEKLYREVQRARQFGRNLGIVALQPSDLLKSGQLEYFVEEVKQNLAAAHARARLGQVVLEAVRDTDLLAMDDDRLYVAVPEADAAQLEDWIRELRGKVVSRLGIRIAAGSAVFPHEEVTLSGLLDRSARNMQYDLHPKREPSDLVSDGVLPETLCGGVTAATGYVGAAAEEPA